MYRRMTCIVVLLAVGILLAACGGGANLTTNTVQSIEPDVSLVTKKVQPNSFKCSALFSSANGPSLFLLDEQGLVTDAATGDYAVDEEVVDDQTFKWQIRVLSPGRDVFFLRVASDTGGYQPIDMRRGDWSPRTKALVTGIPNTENGIDIGVIPLNGEPVSYTDDQVLVCITFSSDSTKFPSDCPSDKTGDGFDIDEHNFYPFYFNPHSTTNFNIVPFNSGVDPYLSSILTLYNNKSIYDLAPYWINNDNRVIAVASGGNHNRDVLGLAYTNGDQATRDAIIEPVYNDRVNYPSEAFIDKLGVPQDGILVGYTIRFSPQLHGDYDRNGMVTISDITPIAQHWLERSKYDALAAATASSTSCPYRNSTSPSGYDAGADFVDGSYDGRVWEPFVDPDTQQLRNQISFPEQIPELQYISDIFPISVHFQEYVSHVYVSLTRQGNAIDPRPIPYDYSGYKAADDLLTDGDPYIMEFNMSVTPRRGKWYKILEGVTYGFEVSMESNGSGPKTSFASFCVPDIPQYTESSDLTPPTWATPGEEGVLEAWPSKDQFRSAVVRVGEAVDNESGIIGFNVYTTLTEPTNPSDWTNPNFVIQHACHQANPSDPNMQFSHRKFRSWDYNPDGPVVFTIQPPDAPNRDWKPGALVGIVVTALSSNPLPEYKESNRIYNQAVFNTPLKVAWTRLSYDSTPPVWHPYDYSYQYPVDKPVGIIKTSAGISPGGQEGYFVYYDWAIDGQTGISEYRIYYSDNAAYATDEAFSAQLDVSPCPLSYISSKDLELLAAGGDEFAEFQLLQRCFFVPAGWLSNTMVLMKAYNGEKFAISGNVTNRTTNRVLLNLTDIEARSSFTRLTLSDLLDPSYNSGDMACNSANQLFIANATIDPNVVVSGSPSKFDINLDGWQYNNCDKSPVVRSSWDGIKIPDGSESMPVVDERAGRGTWSVSRHLNGNNDYDDMYTAKHNQISVAYIHNEWTIANGYIGSPFVDDEDQIEKQYGYLGILSQPSQSLIFSNILYNGYDLNILYPYLSIPCDINKEFMCISRDFMEMSTYLEYTVHSPCLITKDQWSAGSWQEEYQMYGDIGRYQGKILRSAVLHDYISPSQYAFTVFGTSHMEASPQVIAYMHNFYDMDNSSSIDNHINPDESPDMRQPSNFWSWNQVPPQCSRRVINTGVIGTPLEIVARDESGIDFGYIVYNSSPSRGNVGLGLARISQTLFAPMQNTNVNSFVRLYPGANADPYNVYQDGLDIMFGPSYLMNNFGMTGFMPSGDGSISSAISSWVTMEKKFGPGEETDLSKYEPLCVAFIQYDTRLSGDTPGTKVFYGEIYNVEDPANCFMIIELVDSLELINQDYQEAMQDFEQFNPIWCSLAFVEGDCNNLGEPRSIPVIAYGACAPHTAAFAPHEDVEGILRVASLVQFTAIPTELPENYWIYGTGENPDSGETYPNIGGLEVVAHTVDELTHSSGGGKG